MRKLFSIALLFLITFVSCKRNEAKTLVESSGKINHLLVVMKNSDWEGQVGDSIRAILAEPLAGLPQEEAQFRVNQVTPENFTKLFNKSRNILFVGFGDKDLYYTNEDVYATPQITVTLLGKDKAGLFRIISEHKRDIIDVFKKRDLILYQKEITEHHWKPKKVKTFEKQNFSFLIPKSYNKVEDTGDFLWFRFRFSKGENDIIAYTVPLEAKGDLTLKKIIKIRDSIGKKYIPGQFDNTFMKTEPKYRPKTRITKLDGLEAVETRGLWYVENDYMGGPFISYTIHDEANKRIIVLEGFVYSPATKKRNFVFELESILKTFKNKK